MFIWNVYRRVFGEIIIRVLNIFSIYYDVNVYIKNLFKIYNFQFFSSVLESPLSIKNIGYNYLNFFWEYFLVARLIWNLFICSHDLLWMLLYKYIQKFQRQLKLPFWDMK